MLELSSHYWQESLLGIFVLALFAVETYQPFKKDYPYRFLHLGRNAGLAAVNSVFVVVLNVLCLVPACAWATHHSFGLARLFSPGASLLVAFVLFDAWIYLWHRMNHVIPFLWRLHRVHHTDPLLDVSSAFRFHPLELIISTLLNIFIVFILGISLPQLLFYKLFFHGIVVFHHSNVAIPESIDRVLRYAIVTPNMHRVHHSSLYEETNSNYASVFSFWDRGGRSFRQRDVQQIRYGLDKYMEERWQTLPALLRLPFIV